MNKNIESACVDIKDPNSYTKRLDYLAEKLEKTKECREINRRYSKLYKSLENIIPKEKQDLIRQLDDTYMELLIFTKISLQNGCWTSLEFKGF